jgi:DNA-binding GntR family transcriptional regulator
MPISAAMKMTDQGVGEEQQVSSRRVYLGIMRDLEEGRMVPGQRLAETDLATRFGVGRNAVRESIQHLAARGVVDLSPHRSPMIRTLDLAETMEVLDVANAMTGLAARAAALNFQESHAELTAGAIALLEEADSDDEPATFSRARRNFYRVLLHIGGNRELQRLFPAIGMHIIYAQNQSRQLRGIRITDYRQIMDAIAVRKPSAAERAGRAHVENVREIILRSYR